ncbi:MAG: aspartate/glutamate racemase family protein [Atribacterota bacterium]|nr:aspartate/glutamate racemase family protein [Atribacterota bacterium]MDD5637178.1 aspartate/glutamate racemase family protein [Atribacterota bacterium]
MEANLSEGKKKTIIGVIKLDTKFRRIQGDIGNPRTWNFPVIYQIMEGIFPERAVYYTDSELLVKAIETAKILEKKGVNGITTSCGFLGKFQKEISNSVQIPVFTSSLLQIPLIYNLLNKDRKIGVLTANYKSLTKEHLVGSGIKNIPLVIKGMDDYKYFQRVFVKDQLANFNRERVKTEIIDAAIDLRDSCDELGAVVLECTNMSPYAYDMQKYIDLPVFDMCSLMQWMYNGLVKQKFNEIE